MKRASTLSFSYGLLNKINYYDEDNYNKTASIYLLPWVDSEYYGEKSQYCLIYNCNDCITDNDCPHDYTCKKKNDSPLYCQRKELFSNFNYSNIIATIATFVAAAFAAGGGMGGGGLFVPIFILAAGLSVQEAIPLSQVTIFGGALINLIFNLISVHPQDSQKPVIDYVLLQYIQPPMLVGTIMGVFLQVMSPHWLVMITLAVLLTYTSYASIISAFKMFKAETSSKPLPTPVRITIDNNYLPYIPATLQDYNDLTSEKEYYALLARERSTFVHQLIVLAFLAVVIIATLVRGGHPTHPSFAGVYTCTNAFWLATFLAIPALMIFMVYPSIRLRLDYNVKVKLNIHNNPGEIHWTAVNIILYPFIFFLVGIIGGLVGIGGGMFSSPLLLHLGLLPEVAVATSATTVFISSFAAALNFYMLDNLLLDFAGWFMGVGIVGSLFGILVIRYLTKKYKMVSIVSITISIVITISAILMIIVGSIKLYDDIVTNQNLHFRSFCNSIVQTSTK